MPKTLYRNWTIYSTKNNQMQGSREKNIFRINIRKERGSELWQTKYMVFEWIYYEISCSAPESWRIQNGWRRQKKSRKPAQDLKFKKWKNKTIPGSLWKLVNAICKVVSEIFKEQKPNYKPNIALQSYIKYYKNFLAYAFYLLNKVKLQFRKENYKFKIERKC